jgi:hypothetical protein
VLTIFVKGNTFFIHWVPKISIIYQQFIINGRVGKKSMCVVAKGRLQGRAATLLLLWAGFPFSSLSLCSKNFIVIVSLYFFFGLLVTVAAMFCAGFQSTSFSKFPQAKFTNSILLCKDNFRDFLHKNKSKFGDFSVVRCCFIYPLTPHEI